MIKTQTGSQSFVSRVNRKPISPPLVEENREELEREGGEGWFVAQLGSDEIIATPNGHETSWERRNTEGEKERHAHSWI